MAYDAVVVGAGIIGSLSAFSLAKRGLRVLLLDKSHVGAGASGSTAAMLESQTDAHRGEPFLSFARRSNAMFEDLESELRGETGESIGLERNGILNIALSDKEAAALKIEIDRQQSLGLKARWIPPEAIAETWPQLNPEYAGGALFEEDGQVNAEQFLAAAVGAAKRRGATLQEGVSVTLEQEKNRIRVFVNGERVTAGEVVLCAGAWTDRLLEPLGVCLGLEPLKGQMLVYDTPKRILPTPVYTKSKGYITPKSGFTLVGATVERAGFDDTTTETAKTALRTQALQILPTLSRMTLRGMTAGLRPGSPDNLPLLGRLEEWKNISIAAGHFRNGILLAPITAEIVCSMLTGTPPPFPSETFAPGRFLSRTGQTTLQNSK